MDMGGARRPARRGAPGGGLRGRARPLAARRGAEPEPVKQLIGRRVLIVHGTERRSTDPELSYRLAERAKKVNRAGLPVRGPLRRARRCTSTAPKSSPSPRTSSSAPSSTAPTPARSPTPWRPRRPSACACPWPPASAAPYGHERRVCRERVPLERRCGPALPAAGGRARVPRGTAQARHPPRKSGAPGGAGDLRARPSDPSSPDGQPGPGLGGREPRHRHRGRAALTDRTLAPRPGCRPIRRGCSGDAVQHDRGRGERRCRPGRRRTAPSRASSA